ncbi:MAG: DUF4347 domain-containing protein [Phormidesmis sp.]
MQSSVMGQSDIYTSSDQEILVVIDRGVVDCDQIAEDAPLGAKVLMLDVSRDAIAQITAAFQQSSFPFASLHLFVNGSPGVLHFASGDFSLKTLDRYADQLQTWFSYSPSAPNVLNPEIFLYSDRLGTQAAAQELIDTITWLTSATVITASLLN